MIRRKKTTVFRALRAFIGGGLIIALGALGALGAALGWSPSSLASDNTGAARIQQAIEILLRTPTGHALISQALKKWKLGLPDKLTAIVKASDVSRTDAVLTRHYNSVTGVETREREVVVYIRQDQSMESMVQDLAHELVHATSRPAWDPYDPNLTAGAYIKNSIVGRGGEVQAVQTECQVALELSHENGSKLHRCGAYLASGAAASPDVKKITADFYRVGQWRPFLVRALGPEIRLFPLLSDAAPRLYSSTGNAPYPASLLSEFQALTQIACQNSKRRATLAESRSIASAPTFQFIQRRCQ